MAKNSRINYTDHFINFNLNFIDLDVMKLVKITKHIYTN